MIEQDATFIDADGTGREVRESHAFTFDERGRCTGAVVVVRDVSRQRELERLRSVDPGYTAEELITLSVAGDHVDMDFASAHALGAPLLLTRADHLPQATSTEILRLSPQGITIFGGTLAVTVPTWFPEKVCWALSSEYHAPFVEGGHVRIFTEATLRRRFRDAGLKPGQVHHAHALHSPYWWLKCAVGPTNDRNPLVEAYHKLLVWDITKAPKLTRWTEKILNPVLGKSLVLYARKPETP